jgi:hypothetical protein
MNPHLILERFSANSIVPMLPSCHSCPVDLIATAGISIAVPDVLPNCNDDLPAITSAFPRPLSVAVSSGER